MLSFSFIDILFTTSRHIVNLYRHFFNYISDMKYILYIYNIYIYIYIYIGVVESFGCLIIFYIGLKCHFNYFVLYIYICIYILYIYNMVTNKE